MEKANVKATATDKQRPNDTAFKHLTRREALMAASGSQPPERFVLSKQLGYAALRTERRSWALGQSSYRSVSINSQCFSVHCWDKTAVWTPILSPHAVKGLAKYQGKTFLLKDQDVVMAEPQLACTHVTAQKAKV